MKLHLALGALAATQVSAQSPLCKSESQPNPIANQYPNDVTGTINGTTAIIPVPYSVARQLIPSQYGILTRAYEALIPNLPKGMYPVMLQAYLDHDVRGPGGIGPPDFQRAGLRFPFVDRLNDGYTSFQYTTPQLISANPVALVGAGLYGTTYAGTFNPSCNPYTRTGPSETKLQAYKAPHSAQLGSKPSFDLQFKAMSGSPYSIDIFRNLTNQPSFSDALPVCDNYITFYNTSVTKGSFAPVAVEGTVAVRSPFYSTDTIFTDVWGYNVDLAFLERNFVDCNSLQGYRGTGSGDSYVV